MFNLQNLRKMRKTLRMMGLSALVALAVVACKKNDQKTAMTSFEAVITQPNGGAKTEIGDGNVLWWNTDDAIKVFAADGTSEIFTTANNQVPVATFDGEIEASERYCAFYPADNASYAGGNTVTLTLADTQTYKDGTFCTDTYPMKAVNDENSFTFSSPCGLLSIPVHGTGTLGSIELTGNNDEDLAGTYTYSMDNMDNPEFNGTAKKITLTCEPALELSPDEAVTMYFVVPAVTLSQGFTAVMKSTNGDEFYRLVATRNIVIAPQSIENMSEKPIEPGVESFTVDFENGLPEGWTTKDADGDGYNWVLDTQAESAYGYDQSNAGFNGSHMILSGSYHKTAGALHPDNYLVSPKVTLRSGSTLSFWAGAQDYQYPAEHFGVCVSDNGTSDWTMVQEWTMEAKGASGDKGFGRDGNTRDQGRWYYFSVDLSAYAGQRYIAIRHFDCSDQFFLNVDNIRLGDPEPGTSFSQNFNNSVLPEGWTTIDADGDGYNWVLTTQTATYGYSGHNDGHYGTVGMTSGSYHGTVGALTPDNYLVTPKVNLVQGSTFSFWACAQDASYPAEHFGVYVSDNGTDGWTMVQEWTMTAKGASGNKGNGRDGNTRDIGNWYQYTVDLSAYAGEKYIAIRHFNCSDEFFLEVDDILLTVNR